MTAQALHILTYGSWVCGPQLWTMVHGRGLWSTIVDYGPYGRLNSIKRPNHIVLQVFYTTHKSNRRRQTSQKPLSWNIFDHRQHHDY